MVVLALITMLSRGNNDMRMWSRIVLVLTFITVLMFRDDRRRRRIPIFTIGTW